MPDTIDVSGLPEAVVNDLRQLVSALRGRQNVKHGATPSGETPEDWVKRLTAWAESHPNRPIDFDDSRDSIYGGRGE